MGERASDRRLQREQRSGTNRLSIARKGAEEGRQTIAVTVGAAGNGDEATVRGVKTKKAVPAEGPGEGPRVLWEPTTSPTPNKRERSPSSGQKECSWRFDLRAVTEAGAHPSTIWSAYPRNPQFSGKTGFRRKWIPGVLVQPGPHHWLPLARVAVMETSCCRGIPAPSRDRGDTSSPASRKLLRRSQLSCLHAALFPPFATEPQNKPEPEGLSAPGQPLPVWI